MVKIKSQKANTLADELIKKTSSMLDEIASETVQKDGEGDQWEKRSKTLSEVKLVPNISENP